MLTTLSHTLLQYTEYSRFLCLVFCFVILRLQVRRVCLMWPSSMGSFVVLSSWLSVP